MYIRNVVWPVLNYVSRTCPRQIHSLWLFCLLSVPISFAEFYTFKTLDSLLINFADKPISYSIHSSFIILGLSILSFFGKSFAQLNIIRNIGFVKAQLAKAFISSHIQAYRSPSSAVLSESDYFLKADYYPGIVCNDVLLNIFQLPSALCTFIGISIFLFISNFTLSALSISFAASVYIIYSLVLRKNYLSLSRYIHSTQALLKSQDTSFVRNIRSIVGNSDVRSVQSARSSLAIKLVHYESVITVLRTISRYLADISLALIICAFVTIPLFRNDHFLTFLPIFFLSTTKLIPTLNTFNHFYTQLVSTRSSFTEAFQLIRALQTSLPAIPPYPHLYFDSLTIKSDYFRLAHKPLINSLNLTFSPSEKILLKGPSGSGKSLLAGLISGVFDPLSLNAHVLIDKNEITNKFDYRHLSYELPQFPVIPENQTIYQFLTSGSENIDSLPLLLKKFNLSHISDSLHKPPSTFGSSLSGGMLQRLAFIKLVLMPKKPIVILDECVSALDPVNSSILLSHLFSHFRDTLIFYITHDDVSTSFFDRQLLISDKKLTSITL